ncbi:MAG: aminodeoxychorismate synthase component I [Elusimicrobia bacterium CG06_land_8_20_14_3_00_38_11]|nr:MAG: aminodeoxychorismate synthase component I [Elusimicrobia bacterium CG06_land_8_20_14_3_00_38_11]
MHSSSAIDIMNHYGKKKIPFLFIVDFEIKKPVVLPLAEIKSDEILYDINGLKNHHGKLRLNKKIIFRKYPVSFRRYKKAFDKIQKHLYEGHTYLVNLTFPTKVETNLTFREIFFNSTAKYKLFYRNKFVLFSPEIFVRIKDGKISSYPMKGTIDADIPDAADKILSDKKEFAEHITVVDLIRNDISIVAKNVAVKKFRYIDRIKTPDKNILQVSSEITGVLEKNYHKKIGDIIFKLLPAGSITGAPKKKTVEIIKEVENYARGYYTGVFGCFDGQNLDCAVMIRYLEKIGAQIFYKSGGGITTYSDVKSEYRELIDKVYVPIVGNN